MATRGVQELELSDRGCHNVGNATQATAQATNQVLESARRQEQACHWCTEMQADPQPWDGRRVMSVDLCATRTLKVTGDTHTHTVRVQSWLDRMAYCAVYSAVCCVRCCVLCTLLCALLSAVCSAVWSAVLISSPSRHSACRRRPEGVVRVASLASLARPLGFLWVGSMARAFCVVGQAQPNPASLPMAPTIYGSWVGSSDVGQLVGSLPLIW